MTLFPYTTLFRSLLTLRIGFPPENFHWILRLDWVKWRLLVQLLRWPLDLLHYSFHSVRDCAERWFEIRQWLKRIRHFFCWFSFFLQSPVESPTNAHLKFEVWEEEKTDWRSESGEVVESLRVSSLHENGAENGIEREEWIEVFLLDLHLQERFGFFLIFSRFFVVFQIYV